MQCRATTTERAWELVEKSVEELQGKIGEVEVKLAEVSSIVFAWDKELTDLKETMKNCKQVFYNIGFKDTGKLNWGCHLRGSKTRVRRRLDGSSQCDQFT